MKVARWYNNRDIRIEEVPTPSPGPKEMLVKVMACGICGSDVVEWYRLPRAPLVQGHEIGAQVAEVGESVTKFKPGDRVFITPKVPCMKCHYCVNEHYPQCSEVKERLPGGFAEYILVPEILIENGSWLLPENVTYDQSTFIEPLACVIRAQRLAGLKTGHTIMVLGCGISGLLHIELAKFNDAKVIATDINSKRLKFAQKVGADTTILVTHNVPELPGSEIGQLVDVVMLCTSAISAVEQAWKCVDKGGAIVFFAVPGPTQTVPVPINDFWTKEIRILTSYYCGPPDIKEAINLITTGAIKTDDLITHNLLLSEIEKGFQLVVDGKESLKVIINPNE
ncbi:MAG: zinc-dependent dehydrogenase [Proteobacteria bacterium]|nr:zinc-dependent dehydrogenase [Pseudomonadota bacterium]